MSVLRIGLGCTLLERALNGGHLDGIGVYNRNLLAELAGRDGVSVLPVCYPPKPWQPALARAFPGRAAFGRAYGISAAISALTALSFAGASKLERRIDLYHAPDHLIPKMTRIPVVATICDALAVKRPDWIDAGPGAFRSRLFRASARWARRVIAISAAMVPDLVEHLRIPETAISVVHMGIGRDWFEPVAQEVGRKVLDGYGLRAGYYLFVGTLQPRKNVEGLLAAYTALPAELRAARQLVIVGQAGFGSQVLVRRLEAEQRAGGCAWLKYVPAEELHALYQNAGAFVFPSLSEGFGMPVLEAYASGVPVVTSNLSSLPEVAGDAALLVDPRSTAELSGAMARLAQDGALAATLVQKGRARAAHMTWEACAAQTLEAYRMAL